MSKDKKIIIVQTRLLKKMRLGNEEAINYIMAHGQELRQKAETIIS